MGFEFHMSGHSGGTASLSHSSSTILLPPPMPELGFHPPPDAAVPDTLGLLMIGGALTGVCAFRFLRSI